MSFESKHQKQLSADTEILTAQPATSIITELIMKKISKDFIKKTKNRQ